MSTPVHVTADTFDSEVVKSKLPVVIDFWAPWCGPCKQIGPILDDLAAQWAGKVKVAKVNTDQEQALAGAFQVRGIPTLAVVEGGEITDVQVGFRGRQPLEQLFEQLAERSGGSGVAYA